MDNAASCCISTVSSMLQHSKYSFTVHAVNDYTVYQVIYKLYSFKNDLEIEQLFKVILLSGEVTYTLDLHAIF